MSFLTEYKTVCFSPNYFQSAFLLKMAKNIFFEVNNDGVVCKAAARVFYISLVFSNARRVLSQSNT